MTATVMLHLGGEDPRATVLENSNERGARWILLDVGGVTLHLPAYNEACAAYARQIAATLIAAADELDAALASGASGAPQ